MGPIICTKDKVDATEIVLNSYEYEEGIPLRNVPAFKCPVCEEFIFTEAQIDEMERKTDMIKAEMLAFERKVTLTMRLDKVGHLVRAGR
ncbi:MAG: YgiT-type zinc finger protein [Candidatus Lokiarchaeota archaeon]|nr:YgiT-type zinc finger protein [Candidatus Lokiarchaeota archaeon]